jgi:hypothetical protein
MYLLLEDEIDKTNAFTITSQHLAILEAEKAEHIAGISKSYSWEEAKDIITGNKKVD